MAHPCLSVMLVANVPHTYVEPVGFPNPSIAELLYLPLIKNSHSGHKSKGVKKLQHVEPKIFPFSRNV